VKRKQKVKPKPGKTSTNKLNVYLIILIVLVALIDVSLPYTLKYRGPDNAGRHSTPPTDNSGWNNGGKDDLPSQDGDDSNGGNEPDNNPAECDADDVELSKITPPTINNPLSADNPLIKDLKYPQATETGQYGVDNLWLYRDVSIGEISRKEKMLYAADGLKGTDAPEGDPRTFIPASSVHAAYKALFGPDVEYTDGNLDGDPYGFTCDFISKYLADRQVYESHWGCGGGTPYILGNETRFYGAEQAGDEIYTYFYVQPYVYYTGMVEGHSDTNVYYLYNKQDDFNPTYSDDSPPTCYTKQIKKDSKEAALNEIRTMMDDGYVDIYRFTFKKQSDGRYYFASGRWVD
jgi:hypothetical protein